jgi:hemerythrin superfamily protein
MRFERIGARALISQAEGGSQMDALQLLKEDHDTIKKIMSHIESTTERGVKTREEFFTRMKGVLQVHEAIEEEILYPALKEHPKAKDLVLEAYEEHNVVDMVMAEIDETAFDDETWGAKFTVVRENLEHHIDEEESEMFDQCRQIFDRDELIELGEEMEGRKEELEAASAA